MQKLTLELTEMANGGAALGRDDRDRVIFVPQTIPGEVALVEVVETKKRFAWGQLLEIIHLSRERVDPRCPYFGICNGCHFQHIRYEDQLRYKGMVVSDQLMRIGGLHDIPLKPMLANPEPWAYAVEVTFSPTSEGRLGFWSNKLSSVIPIESCPITRQDLMNLFQDIDLDLAGLNKLVLRQGADGSMLASLEIEGADPPSLKTDLPISAVLMIEGGLVANLIGDNHLVQSVLQRPFRVSAGSFFYPSPAACDLLVETVSQYAASEVAHKIIELYSGVGMITSFLCDESPEIITIEQNAGAITDAVVNLADAENISLYEGRVEEILPLLSDKPDLIIVDPPRSGLPPEVIDQLSAKSPIALIYVSSDVATLARDAKRLSRKGFFLREIQPIDMYPQSYHTLTVSKWKRTD